MNNFLKLNNLSKKYEKNKSLKVLNNINFKFESGKVYSIIGPSGSGKSTLLNLLSLIDIPSSGFIEFNEKKIDINSSIENDYIRSKNIGIIYQDKNLLSDFTAMENVYLANLLLSNNQTSSMNLAKKIIKSVGLSSRLNHLPSELSGGENQRIAIARALINNPKIILADEPTGNLDPNISDEILDLLETFTANGSAVLMSTHNFPLIKPRNKKFIELSKGRMV